MADLQIPPVSYGPNAELDALRQGQILGQNQQASNKLQQRHSRATYVFTTDTITIDVTIYNGGNVNADDLASTIRFLQNLRLPAI